MNAKYLNRHNKFSSKIINISINSNILFLYALFFFFFLFDFAYCQNLIVKYEVNRIGSDFEQRTVNSFEECSYICISNAKCASFSLSDESDGHICYLKSSVASFVFQKNYLSADRLFASKEFMRNISDFELSKKILSTDHFRKVEVNPQFSIFIGDKFIVYLNLDCSDQTIINKFFLHLYPENIGSLSSSDMHFQAVKSNGFAVLDFSIDNNYRVGSTCLKTSILPNWTIKEIRTGQYTLQGPRTWELIVDLLH